MILIVFSLSLIPSQSSTMLSQDSLITGINEFGFSLYRTIVEGEDSVNEFLSPYSIYVALGMVYEGAKEKTKKEMAEVLGTMGFELGSPLKTLKETLKSDSEIVFTVANGLWIQKGFPILNSYEEKMSRFYHGEFFTEDFVSDPEGARMRINRWVEDKTREKIKELFKKGDISPGIRLVLANAIYFLGEWRYKFNKKLTKKEPFFTGSETLMVDMMHTEGRFGYMKGEGFKALKLDYSNSDFFMLILLPDDIDKMKKLENSLSDDMLRGILRSMQQRSLSVSVPGFNLVKPYELNNYLVKLGMKTAFTPLADFSGITGKKDLYISKVVHKAYIEVNEKGTEAAAATGIAMKLTVARKPEEFRADHPFVFLIMHRTGVVLFMGRLVNPEE